jgi:5-methylcytosine-specific restriction enzyme subunit McrC
MAITVGEGKTNIPVRSLWLLLIYSSDMLHELRSEERDSLLAGDHDADLIGAVAEVLVTEVEMRIRKQLTFHYRRTSADLTRVRGRINHLRTQTNCLLDQGRIACTYEALSVNSPRNRFIAATLLEAASIVGSAAPNPVKSRELSRRCADAAFAMQRIGVNPEPPTRAELSRDRLGNHDSHDRRMLDAAHLVHDMSLPFHERGPRNVPRLVRDERKYRKLFESAVRGYLSFTLDSYEWTVGNPHLKWPYKSVGGADDLLPIMKTDIVITNVTQQRRVVIETKFKDAMVEHHGKTTVNPDFVFQLYAYLRSQSGRGEAIYDNAEGVLLFVAANGREPVDRSVNIQGHRIRFLSVDLSGTPRAIRERWSLCAVPQQPLTPTPTK